MVPEAQFPEKATVDLTEERKEIRRLQKELKEAQLERDILKWPRPDHTAKNGLIFDDGAQIVYLSPTYESKKHDKAI